MALLAVRGDFLIAGLAYRSQAYLDERRSEDEYKKRNKEWFKGNAQEQSILLNCCVREIVIDLGYQKIAKKMFDYLKNT